MTMLKLERIIHRTLIFLCLGAVIVLGYLGVQKLTSLNQQIGSLAKENYTLNLQVANLQLMADDTAYLLRLEEELLKHTGGKLGSRLPYVAVKLIEQAKMYRDDGLELSLLLAIIEVESGFDPRAQSPANAYGLMQVLRSAAKPILEKSGREWSAEAMFNPEVNIEVGTYFLVELHRGYMACGLEDPNEWHLSIDAYFWGERWVYESLSGASSTRTGFASRSYWAKVRTAQLKWRDLGF